MSKMLDYGRTFNLWRDSAPKSWDGYVNHRFVIGLSDGTLPRKEFLNYLRQDYLFLEKFVSNVFFRYTHFAGMAKRAMQHEQNVQEKTALKILKM